FVEHRLRDAPLPRDGAVRFCSKVSIMAAGERRPLRSDGDGLRSGVGGPGEAMEWQEKHRSGEVMPMAGADVKGGADRGRSYFIPEAGDASAPTERSK